MRIRWAVVAAALALAGARAASAQRVDTLHIPPRGAVDTLRQRADSARRRSDSLAAAAADTGRGRALGLPRRPSRSFPQPDSVLRALLARRGFRMTRYGADSVTFLAPEHEIRLAGHSLVEREGSTLEADSVRYAETPCALFAVGKPRLFDQTGVMIGEGMVYDACNHAGIVERAITDFQEGRATWFLHGNLAVDNLENRVYAARANITSCDLPDPHYHFAARQVKWISKRLMVSRPAILYVADVPILWLPFIFQDMRRGRRSGLIPPQFGINDIVRNSHDYQRHVANLGYYWVLNDYSDAQLTFDWYANRFITLNGRIRYRWLDRFIAGGINYQEQRETTGNSSRRISWSHQQQFSLRSQLTANIDYASSSTVISRNAVDPVLAIATIHSDLNFQQRLDWGTLAVGGNRTQYLDKPLVVTTFPTVSFTPNPIAISPSVTWSPSFSVTNQLQSNAPGALLPTGPLPGDTLRQLADSRSTAISVGTPLRIGRWNWSNSVSVSDEWRTSRDTVNVPDPADSTRRLVRTYGEFFQTGVDWQTGINLPVLFQGSWNLSPSVQIVNTTSGPFLIRNRFTGGGFVSQGKRLQYAASVSPTFFALFGGLGPVARIRHSISPSFSYAYSPAASVPVDFARAISPNGRTAVLTSDARQTITIGLSQNFEAKLRPPPRSGGADTSAAGAAGTPGAAGAPEPEARKIKLLSIQTSGLSFDLEQAKKPGRTAWTTGTLTNTFQSDLLRGFSLSTNHSLFDGPVGFVGSGFRPFLTNVSAGFALTPATLGSLGSILGLHAPPPARTAPRADSLAERDTSGIPLSPAFDRLLSTRFSAVDRAAPRAGGGGFSANFSYSLSRQRPTTTATTGSGLTGAPAGPAQQTVNGSVSFSPTAHWSVSWQTSYDFERGQFSTHTIRLDRDLHDWRATFTFVKSPNGNFAFSFFVQLLDQPEIKFDYDQRSLVAP